MKLANAEEERADPAAADRSYEAAVSVLREATRDRQQFPLVFAENVSYGFRRNAWAIRPLGVITSGLALLATIRSLVLSDGAQFNDPGGLWGLLVANVLLLLFWLLGATRTWVQQAANDYATALFAAAAVALDRDDK